MATDFVDLEAWKASAQLAVQVGAVARRLRGFGCAAAAMQMVRAAESVPANIAEGYGRGLGPDGARLLRIARASATELESHLRVAALGGRLPPGELAPLIADARRVRALLNGLLRFAAQRKGPGQPRSPGSPASPRTPDP